MLLWWRNRFPYNDWAFKRWNVKLISSRIRLFFYPTINLTFFMKHLLHLFVRGKKLYWSSSKRLISSSFCSGVRSSTGKFKCFLAFLILLQLFIKFTNLCARIKTINSLLYYLIFPLSSHQRILDWYKYHTNCHKCR